MRKTTAVKHQIHLKPDICSAFQHACWAGLETRKHEGQETDRKLKKGLIQPAMSEWASHVVSDPKKEGILPFCGDLKKLRATIVKLQTRRHKYMSATTRWKMEPYSVQLTGTVNTRRMSHPRRTAMKLLFLAIKSCSNFSRCHSN